MYKQFIITIFSTISLSSFAQPNGSGNGVGQKDLQLNAITTALPFMSITPDSRAGAMGEAGTALDGTSSSIYWNTSSLIFAKERTEIGLSYVPWLRQLTNDIHLSYLSGYHQISDRHVFGGAIRYFSLGEITYTTEDAQVIREDKPSEFELTGAYGFRLSERLAIGLNGKFAYSDLTGGITQGGIISKPAIAGASDLSLTYYNEDARYGKKNGAYTFAVTLNNIGNKVSYSEVNTRDFIPMNLKIGNALKIELDNYNSLTWSTDFQRLLVPTPPIIVNNEIKAGRTSDVGVIAGLMQSFYDAPGTPVKDESGNIVTNPDGTYQIQKNSRLKEELAEINIATGFEYWYNNLLAIRTGLFYESKAKGGRQFMNLGFGLKYNNLNVDMSYLLAIGNRNSPLANTLRFTFRIVLGNKKGE
ncbi:MAG: type IX secretion system outer membrane channel protein PorV [Bacteroidetes bacterium]|nr:type IX secretion system outer membrane channel protein PorV [Bacteroidota bacterium]